MKALIKESRADHIILHAQEVFFNKGFSKTTLSDICKIADCSRTTLYSYFESKENLYLAVIERAFKHFIGFFTSLRKKELSGFEQILAYSMGYIRFAKESPKYYESVLDFYGLIRNVDEENLQTELQSKIKASSNFEQVRAIASLPLKLLTEEIARGQKDGSINMRYSAEEQMIHIWAYLKGISDISPNLPYISTSFAKQEDLEAPVKNFLRVMLEA